MIVGFLGLPGAVAVVWGLWGLALTSLFPPSYPGAPDMGGPGATTFAVVALTGAGVPPLSAAVLYPLARRWLLVVGVVLLLTVGGLAGSLHQAS